MIIFLITVALSGCKNEEKSIMDNNNSETLESMKFLEQNINRGSDEVMSNSQESYINCDNKSFTGMSKVNISLEDITRQTLVFYVENFSEEGIVIGKIYLKEYLNEQWIEMKTDGSQMKSPACGLAPNGTGEIEYNFDAIYGELSKGEYICVIKINDELKEIKFEIK